MVALVNRSFRLPRIWSNSILRELGKVFSGEVINVSGWDDRDKGGKRYRDYFSSATAYYVSNYSGKRGMADADATDFSIDLSIPIPDEFVKRFDVVFNHTTLEHIFEVRVAFQNLCRMSRDIAIVVVPFTQQMHFTSSYGDYWRFTPMCLRRLFRENGFHVVFEAASPFTNAGIYLLFIGSCHPERWYDKMPNWQPIEEVGGWIGYTRLWAVRQGLVRLKKAVGDLF